MSDSREPFSTEDTPERPAPNSLLELLGWTLDWKRVEQAEGSAPTPTTAGEPSSLEGNQATGTPQGSEDGKPG